MSTADRSARSAADLQRINQMEYVPVQPITLNQAIARAVAFNLQRRVKEIEREIEDAELQTKSFEMLPSFDIDAARNKTSKQLSASDDVITRTASAGITWNILDLGVSYARAQQQADEVLIAREKERKALQDIIREVRTAYWRAAGAQRLMGKVQGIARNIKVAMRESRAMERSGANDVVKSVAYRREIVESVRQALTIQRELREARGELAEHLNIRPGTPFKIATATLASAMPVLPMSLPEMEKHALENRPELRVEDYNERMSDWQAREALFDMLPGAKLTAGQNYTSDSFSLTPNWLSTGFQLGMNLFDLFSGTSKMDEAEKRGELARQQRLAMTLAVMTQTHMAYIQFRNASQQMRLAREVARADRRLAQLVASDTDFVNTDYFEAVRLATRQLQSEADEHQTQVDLITAHSDVMHAIGLNVLPENLRTDNVAELTAEISKVTARWEVRGKDVAVPADTPLDLLVNAMLLGGEQAPQPARRNDETREARAIEMPGTPESELPDIPPMDPSDLNDIVTASGTPGPPGMPGTHGVPGTLAPALTPIPVSASVIPEMPAFALPTIPVELPAAPVEPPVVSVQKTVPVPQKVASLQPAGFAVQLGAFRIKSKAERLRHRLTSAPDAALYGVDIRIVRRKSGRGETLHYVETVAIPEQSVARDLCQTLKGLGQDCISVTR
ncbi:MAG: multidrug efflux system outer membrane protein [Alphaproteobacteria bacterium]|jgi:multidrug efflux system outer membrane protein